MIDQSTKDRADFFRWLVADCGYIDAKPIGDDRWAAIQPLLFTHSLVTGHVGDRSSIDDRWCYHNYSSAHAALEAWDGTGEPQGWHRHPGSGRRRKDGVEYVAM